MPVKPVTYWEITCDHEGCKLGLFDVNGEFSAMSEESHAIDMWVDAEGVLLPDGRALCRDHRPGCEDCGGWLEDPTESPRCEDCAGGDDPEEAPNAMDGFGPSYPGATDGG